MKLHLCFLWHMHQPYYKDPETETYILPWVRLHAIKDYVALPRLFREIPAVRHTFNLVPSLLIQVQDYVENGAEDVFLTVPEELPGSHERGGGVSPPQLLLRLSPHHDPAPEAICGPVREKGSRGTGVG